MPKLNIVYHCLECGADSITEDEAVSHLKLGINHVSLKSIKRYGCYYPYVEEDEVEEEA